MGDVGLMDKMDIEMVLGLVFTVALSIVVGRMVAWYFV